jgi:hypothetical protein
MMMATLRPPRAGDAINHTELEWNRYRDEVALQATKALLVTFEKVCWTVPRALSLPYTVQCGTSSRSSVSAAPEQGMVCAWSADVCIFKFVCVELKAYTRAAVQELRQQLLKDVRDVLSHRVYRALKDKVGVLPVAHNEIEADISKMERDDDYDVCRGAGRGVWLIVCPHVVIGCVGPDRGWCLQWM